MFSYVFLVAVGMSVSQRFAVQLDADFFFSHLPFVFVCSCHQLVLLQQSLKLEMVFHWSVKGKVGKRVKEARWGEGEDG